MQLPIAGFSIISLIQAKVELSESRVSGQFFFEALALRKP
jgi:hypothetical protein